MPSAPVPPRRPALLDFRFGAVALIGSLTMALVAAFAPLPAQVAVLGALVSILGGLFFSYLEQEARREARRDEIVERLAVPLTLAPEHDLYDQYLAICRGLTGLVRNTDPILREIAALKLASVAGQIDDLAAGSVVFAGTEGWRAVYDQILKSPDLKTYQSVAWVRSKDYWRDQPGRQSMEANYQAADRGVLVERVIILPDELWPKGAAFPTGDILPWVREQHDNGLWVALVRQADVAGEPDLLWDLGIYGDRAVGVQELDERARTVRFTLQFDPQAVRLARERWRRLNLYVTPFADLLDREPPPG